MPCEKTVYHWGNAGLKLYLKIAYSLLNKDFKVLWSNVPVFYIFYNITPLAKLF